MGRTLENRASGQESAGDCGSVFRNVVIRGDGVAASCCSYLLSRDGWSVATEALGRPRLPALLLTDNALALIRDIFGGGNLFEKVHRIRRRVVAWGPHAAPVTLNHSAVVVSEDALLQSLRQGTHSELREDVAHWTIFASRPLPRSTMEHAFGSRVAFAAPVNLKNTADREACWIESLENGWLFLISSGEGRGALLSVGAHPDVLLGRSCLTVRQIHEFREKASQFPAYPRLASPLCGDGWLACGSAAMGFDPICGDGTAHAIREAILATAVIRACEHAPLTQPLFAHYEARLTAAFRRHIALCREFYRSGSAGMWWESELHSLEHGLEWCDARLGRATNFRYKLVGLDLQPADPDFTATGRSDHERLEA